MTDYHYNQSQDMDQPALHSPVTTQEVQHSILEAYAWMFGGLLLTGLISMAFYKFGWMYTMLSSFPMLVYLLPLVQIGLAVGFSASMARASAPVLKTLFVLYAASMGISLSSLLFVYTDGTIYLAFFISALYFGCLCWIGMTTKRDLTRLGTIAVASLLALLISQILMMLFGVPMDIRLYSVIGLLIFTGLTAYDVQRLNHTMLYAQGQPTAQKKWAIYFALELYLDFINVFLYILQLLGSNASSRRS